MTDRAEALAKMGWMILKAMPAERREEILNTPGMVEEFIAAVKQIAINSHRGAKLNNMTLDEYMKAQKLMLNPKGKA